MSILKQMQASLSALFPSKGIENMSEAEIAQTMADLAENAAPASNTEVKPASDVVVADAVATTETPAIETESDANAPDVIVAEIPSGISADQVQLQVTALADLVAAQSKIIGEQRTIIAKLGQDVATLSTTSKVLATKIGTILVSNTSAPTTAQEAVAATSLNSNSSNKDEKVVVMNFSDVISGGRELPNNKKS
jgi:hypothetical protein